jgi:hypothetical protein
MIQYKGTNYETLTDRVLPTAQRSVLCKMSSGSKVYDGYSKPGLWLSTAMEVGVHRNT